MVDFFPFSFFSLDREEYIVAERSLDLKRHSTVTIVYMFLKKLLENVEKEKRGNATTLWQMFKCVLRQSSKSVKGRSCLFSVVTLQKS